MNPLMEMTPQETSQFLQSLPELWPYLTPPERAEIVQLMERLNNAAPSLLEYVVRTFPGYEVAPHHVLLADTLEKVQRREIKRLMVFMPPRHGKTELTGQRFPAWCLGKNPDKRLMICSYSDAKAYGLSRAVRGQVQDTDRWPFPDVKIAYGEASMANWSLEGRRGGCLAAGVGGGITGHGADILIIDDPIKGREQADSPTWREKNWQWYTSDAYTRLEPDAAVILQMTRWHEDDLAGRLVDLQTELAKRMLRGEDPGDEPWYILDLPARSFGEDVDPLKRPEGAVLWPNRWDERVMRGIQNTIGERAWNSEYQQKPTTQEGLVFKRNWFGRRFRSIADLTIRRVAIVVDSAFKTGVANSFSVAALWFAGAMDGEQVCGVLDVWRKRVEYSDLETAIKDFHAKWARTLGRPIDTYIEDKASGQSLIQTLKRNSDVPAIAWHDPYGENKEARAEAATPMFRAGRVVLPDGAVWVGDWVAEHCDFPTAKFNDQVDTSGMGIDVLFGLADQAKKGKKEPLPEGFSSWATGASSPHGGGSKRGGVIRADEAAIDRLLGIGGRS